LPTSSEQHGKCMIIAEVAQAHDGSLGTAHAYIDAVACAGADAVKFQTHIAAAESTVAEPWRVRFSPQDASRYDYWKRMEFTEDQWTGLKRHAEDRGLKFISSPFSIAAVDLLSRVGVSAWKVASGEVSNGPLIKRVLATGLPILLSTGMSTTEHIDAVVEQIQRHEIDLTLLQCTSSYPCPPEKIGINLIPLFQRKYRCKAGLSDHSGTIFPALACATLGADAVEVHVTFSRECFGPDVPSSVTTSELKQLVEGVRYIARMRNNPVQKDEVAAEMEPMRHIFSRSVALHADLPAGTVLQASDLTLKKPGTGIAPEEMPRLIGRRLARAVRANELLQEDDLTVDVGAVAAG